MVSLLIGIPLIATVVLLVLRRLKSDKKRDTLCWRCRYDHLDICAEPQRGRAKECPLFLEQEEEPEEYVEYDDVPDWEKD